MNTLHLLMNTHHLMMNTDHLMTNTHNLLMITHNLLMNTSSSSRNRRFMNISVHVKNQKLENRKLTKIWK